MKLFNKLDVHLQSSLLIISIAVITFLASIYCFFISLAEVPLGLLLAGVITSLLHLSTHLFVNLDVRNGTVKYSVISVIIRYVVLITSVVMIGLLYYYWKVKLFNLFAFIGVYTLDVVIFSVLHIKNKN